jgi:prevent-host-death family protein
MLTANIATAKNELSRLLRRVKNGERVIITDRNRPVARLEPIAADDPAARADTLLALQEAGVLTPPLRPSFNVKTFVATKGPTLAKGRGLAAAILEEREDGR